MCGDKVDLTQKRSCDGGIEEASPSKTHGPTQTYKLDDTTSEASSNRTSAMSTRNCTRENGTLECVKSQQDENHSWLFVVVLLCVLLPFTFQNVSLSTHVNFDSVVLSNLDLSLLPASLFEQPSMGQACNPPTQRTTLSVLSVLSCPLWPCSHRMCVSSPKRLGCLHWLAHAAEHGYFLKRLHIWALRSLCLNTIHV